MQTHYLVVKNYPTLQGSSWATTRLTNLDHYPARCGWAETIVGKERFLMPSAKKMVKKNSFALEPSIKSDRPVLFLLKRFIISSETLSLAWVALIYFSLPEWRKPENIQLNPSLEFDRMSFFHGLGMIQKVVSGKQKSCFYLLFKSLASLVLSFHSCCETVGTGSSSTPSLRRTSTNVWRVLRKLKYTY